MGLQFLKNLPTKIFGEQKITLTPGQPAKYETIQPNIFERIGNFASSLMPKKSEVMAQQPAVKVAPTLSPTQMPTPSQAPKLQLLPTVQPNIPTMKPQRPAEITQEVPMYKNPAANIIDTPSYAPVKSAIASAAGEFGVDQSLLTDIAHAESKLNPQAKASDAGYDGVTIDKNTGKPYPYSSAAGLFQFTDASWKQMMNELRLPQTTPKYDPSANARAAALAISKGRIGWWNASKHDWGQYHQ